MEQIHTFKRRVRQPRQNVQSIAHVQPDIAELISLNVLQRPDHTVDERLAANESMLGMQFCLPRQVFSGAETDLELQRTTIAKQCAGIERTIRNTDPRQQVLDKPSLPDP